MSNYQFEYLWFAKDFANKLFTKPKGEVRWKAEKLEILDRGTYDELWVKLRRKDGWETVNIPWEAFKNEWHRVAKLKVDHKEECLERAYPLWIDKKPWAED